MWVHLAEWIVGDGEVPHLRPGDLLEDHGLRASCWNITPAAGPDGVVLLDRPDPTGGMTLHYAITGTAVEVKAPSTVGIDVGPFAVVAEPNTFRRLPTKRGRGHAVEPWSPTFHLPEVGARVCVTATLEVMADYETEAFGLPDVRRTWQVDGLQCQDHRSGQVQRVELAAMDSADPRQYNSAAYLLDLRPA